MTTTKQAIKAARAEGLTPKPFGGKGGHPDYQANLEKVSRTPLGRPGYGAGQTECCAFCGRLVRGDVYRCWTEIGGSFDEWSENPDAVGYYPLGSDCALALAAIVPVYTSTGIRL